MTIAIWTNQNCAGALIQLDARDLATMSLQNGNITGSYIFF